MMKSITMNHRRLKMLKNLYSSMVAVTYCAAVVALVWMTAAAVPTAL